MINCKVCKKETDIEFEYCCTGSKSNISCLCNGNPINETRDYLCDECKETIDKLNAAGFGVIDSEGDEV